MPGNAGGLHLVQFAQGFESVVTDGGWREWQTGRKSHAVAQ